MADTFDYIVLGAGSAGATLANRLSALPDNRVLLLEAGGNDNHIWLKIPLGVGKVMGDDRYSWNLSTQPEPHLNNRNIVWHHGRVVGGSSSINGMLVVRGEPKRYDEWAREGGPGWSHSELLPVLKRLEDCPFGDPKKRGRGGPIPVHRLDIDDPLTQAFIAGSQELGLPFNDDYNDGQCEGVSHNQLNTRGGRRWGTARAYLDPARKRANFTLQTKALVRRVVLKEGRAVGVEYDVDGRTVMAHANREVIISCGALHSPQVLEHSGIGNSKRLRDVGIEPTHHLPGVGENLLDHLHARLQFEGKHKVTANDMLNSHWFAMRELARYALFRKGLLRTPSLKATGFTRSPRAKDFPDVRFQLGLTSGTARDPKEGLDPFSGFNLGAYDLYPTSTGSVHVVSPDPKEAPHMFANYMATERDVAVNVWAMQFLRRLANAPAMREVIVREVRPGPDVSNDEDFAEYIRETAQTSWHPVGSCKMGDDDMAVVDSQLRVRGLSGLRVADASVMPFHVASNTNIPSIAVGEKAADLILGNRQ